MEPQVKLKEEETSLSVRRIKAQESFPCHIDHAAIYLDGAVITATAEAALKPGRNKCWLTGLPDGALKDSLRLTVPDGIIGYHLSSVETVRIEEGEDAHTRIREIRRKIETEQKRLEFQKEMLEAWRRSLDILKNDGVTPESAAQYLKTAPQEMERINGEIEKLQAALLTLQEEKDRYDHDWNRDVLCGVQVELWATEEGTYPLKISFNNILVEWAPFYDIEASNTEEPLLLHLKAKVRQKTQQNWSNVAVTLLSSRVHTGNNMPGLKPWHVELWSPTPIRAPVYAGVEMAAPTSAFSGGETTVLMPPDTKIVNETMMQYHLPGRYDLEKGESGNLLNVADTRIPAHYCYYATPKAENHVFLMAEIENIAQYNLFDCEANVYMDRSLVGRVRITPQQTEALFNLSLGRDHRIEVNRERTACRESAARLKNERSRYYEYRIRAVNNRNTPVELVIIDQIPVANNKEITVELQKFPGAQPRINQLNGELRWKGSLQAKERIQVSFGFTVTWPKDRTLEMN